MSPGLRLALGLTLGGWVVLEAVALLTVALGSPVSHDANYGFTPVPLQGIAGVLFGPWQRGDVDWYRHLAQFGYRSTGAVGAAFPPLFPALVSVAAHAGAGYALGGVLVNGISLCGAFWLLYNLCERELGNAVFARRAVVLMAVAPAAFFLYAPLTESTFLFLTILTFLLGRRHRLLLAGCVAAVAALDRDQGMLLVMPLLVIAFQSWRQEGGEGLTALARRVAAVTLPTFFAIGAVAAFFSVQGLGLGLVSAERLWGGHFALPSQVVVDSIATILHDTQASPGELVSFITVMVLCAALPLMARRLPVPYTVYSAASVIVLLFHESGASPLMSASRFGVVVFPCFMLLATLVGPRQARMFMGTFATAGLVLFILTTSYVFIG